MNTRLSKSKVGTYDLCSWKFKLQNIDNIQEPKTPFAIYAQEGTDFHEGVVRFFSTIQSLNKILNKEFTLEEIKEIMKCKELYVENFINKFVTPILLKSCKGNSKYYFPVLMEEKIYNAKWDFSGIVDAVFINPKDDEYVIVDWKTGKLKSSVEVKQELAYYKFIIDESGKLDKPVKYGAIFFVKEGKLFYDELTDEDVNNIKNKITETRQNIKEKKFVKNPKVCFFCGYSMRFGGFCDEGKG